MVQKFRVTWKSCNSGKLCSDVFNNWCELSGCLSTLVELNAYDVVITFSSEQKTINKSDL